MNNRNVGPKLSQIREVIQRIKEDGTRNEQDLRTRVNSTMFHHLRGLMH